MTNYIDSYVDSKMVENDRYDIVVPEDMGRKENVDEIELMEETACDEDEAKQDHLGNLDEYIHLSIYLLLCEKVLGLARSIPSVNISFTRTTERRDKEHTSIYVKTQVPGKKPRLFVVIIF